MQPPARRADPAALRRAGRDRRAAVDARFDAARHRPHLADRPPWTGPCPRHCQAPRPQPHGRKPRFARWREQWWISARTPPASSSGIIPLPADQPPERPYRPEAPKPPSAEEARERLRGMMRPALDGAPDERPRASRPPGAPPQKDYDKLRSTAFTGVEVFFETALADLLDIDFTRAHMIVRATHYADLTTALRALDMAPAEAFVLVASIFPGPLRASGGDPGLPRSLRNAASRRGARGGRRLEEPKPRRWRYARRWRSSRRSWAANSDERLGPADAQGVVIGISSDKRQCARLHFHDPQVWVEAGLHAPVAPASRPPAKRPRGATNCRSCGCASS